MEMEKSGEKRKEEEKREVKERGERDGEKWERLKNNRDFLKNITNQQNIYLV